MERPKVYCTYCNTQIVGDVVSWWGDNPYHKHHTPDKTKNLSQRGLETAPPRFPIVPRGIKLRNLQ